jgi:hypothetical protein
MIMQVHDELVFEVREKDAESVAAVVQRVMENACNPTLSLSGRCMCVGESKQERERVDRAAHDWHSVEWTKEFVAIWLVLGLEAR